MKIVKVIGASIGVIVCFFYLGCGGVQIAEAAHQNVSPLAIATKILPSAIVGTPYVAVLDATGGTLGYSWKVSSGSLPSGLTLAATTGVISGTPSKSGNFSFSVTLSDAGKPSQKMTTAMSISVVAPPLAIVAPSLPSAVYGQAYTLTLQATGGVPSYKWSITSGSLPTGLALSPAGVISGTPTASGTSNFTATVSDSGNTAQKASLGMTIVVAPAKLQIISSPLPAAVAGTSYSQTLQASGGTPSYKWSVTSGSLPAGLSLSSTGTISGVASTAGNSTFTVSVSDNSSPTQTASATISIAVSGTKLSITTSALPSVTVGATYSQSFKAAGGTAPYTWSITSGALPAGLSLASTGTVSGAPTASGTSNFTVTVTDSSSPKQTASAVTSVVVASTQLAIVASTLPSVTVGTGYSQSLKAAGGTAPYTWSITSGALPAGLALAPSTGTISGTPTASGTSKFTVTVTDKSSPVQTASAVTSIVVAPTQLAIVASTLPGTKVGAPYSQALKATGGTASYTWSITSGKLPTGLALTASTGTISGVPTSSGVAAFTATVVDSGTPAQAASAATTVSVSPVLLTITSSALPSVTAGTAYSQALQATGGATPYTWGITSGNLPAGLALNPSTGAIAGTPTKAGTSTFTATVTDSSSPAQVTSATASVVVAPSSDVAPAALSITTTSLPSDSVGTAYSQSLQASGGTAPYSWSLSSGELPAGLSISSTGVISGTPTTGGTSNFTVQVSDSGSPAQTKSAGLAIANGASPLAITSSTLAPATSNTAYSQTLSASGGTPAYTWSITSGSLPSGLTLAATTGVISGTPTGSGTTNFTVAVSDSGNPVQTQSASTSITFAAALASGPNTTWYIRPDGGTRGRTGVPAQCDGKADVAYPGTGTDQHCAFNDFRYLYDDKSYNGISAGWIISGGDTVVIRGCYDPDDNGDGSTSCRIGGDPPGHPDTWCVGGSSGLGGCSAGPIPAGTAQQHTKFYGQCVLSGTCNSGNSTIQSNLTQIFGGSGLGTSINLGSTQFVDFEGIEVTRHSQCIAAGSPAFPAQCVRGTDDSVDIGLATDAKTADVLLQDVWIHGNSNTGIRGPMGGQITANRVNISYNGQAGWNFDDGSATPTGPNAAWVITYSQIEWNGCNQEYPMVHTYPAISCYGQSTQGYGDGVGTAPGYCFNVTMDHVTFDHNTQDGLDLGHFNTVNRADGKCIVSITNSLAYANNGQPFKWGPAPTQTTFTNNVVIANCHRMSAPIPGAPSTYNANLSDFCRASDALSFNFFAGSQLLMANNTVISYAPVLFDVACEDASGSCPGALWTLENNILLGYNNQPFLDYGGNGLPGAFCGPHCNDSTQPWPTVNRSNNLFYGFRGVTCPTGNAGEVCVDPLFVSEPTLNGPNFVESELDNYNAVLSNASPAIGSAISLPSVLLDYTGVQRANPPSIGAYEQ